MNQHIKIIIITISFLTLITSCSKNKTEVQLKGEIEAYEEAEIQILNPFMHPVDTLLISDKKTVEKTFKNRKGLHYLLNSNKIWPVYFIPGKRTSFKINVQEMDVDYTGDTKEVNTYIYTKSKNVGVSFHKFKVDFRANDTDFINALKSFEKYNDSIINSYKNLPKDFIALEKRNLKYEFLHDLNTYINVNNSSTPNKVSDLYKSEIKNIDFNTINTDDFLYSKDYVKLINAELVASTKEKLKNDSILDYNTTYLKEIQGITNEKVRNILAFNEAYINKAILNSENPIAYINLFKTISSNEEHLAKVEKLNVALSTIKSGNPSPKFENYQSFDGKRVSLDDLKGKYVYIDMWATWCIPCKKEVPYLKEIEDTYKDKNIVFVDISIDKLKDYDKWKEMVSSGNLPGKQLIADKDFNSDFARKYLTEFIPRFIFIDDKGMIIDAFAPRPSQKKQLTTLFNKYL